MNKIIIITTLSLLACNLYAGDFPTPQQPSSFKDSTKVAGIKRKLSDIEKSKDLGRPQKHDQGKLGLGFNSEFTQTTASTKPYTKEERAALKTQLEQKLHRLSKGFNQELTQAVKQKNAVNPPPSRPYIPEERDLLQQQITSKPQPGTNARLAVNSELTQTIFPKKTKIKEAQNTKKPQPELELNISAEELNISAFLKDDSLNDDFNFDYDDNIGDILLSMSGEN